MKQSDFEDVHWRKVVFYRFMRMNVLNRIFENGIILPSHNAPEMSISDVSCQWFQSFIHRVGYSRETDLLNGTSYDDLVNWVRQNIDYITLSSVKTGSMGQAYTPFLSASVWWMGWPHGINQFLYNGGVIAEMLVPEEEVLLPVWWSQNEWEKEVYLTKIKIDWILRTFVDPSQLEKEILQNPSHPMNRYYDKERSDRIAHTINQWRFREKKVDYLPKGWMESFLDSKKLRVRDGKYYLV